MKKFIVVFLFPFLILGFNFKNFSLLNEKNNKGKLKLDQNETIVELETSKISGFTGITTDTNGDEYADTLYMWGRNSGGQIGNGSSSNFESASKITPQDQDDWGGNIIDLELGSANSGVTVDTDLDGYADTLYIWGSNANGQIGNGTTTGVLWPTKITLQNQDDWGGNLIDFEFSNNFSGVTVDTDLDGYADTLYMWGFNGDGQISLTYHDPHVPSIVLPSDQDDWNGNLIDLELGRNSSGVTVDTDLDGYADTLYMWGGNYHGQLGNGINNNKSSGRYKTTPQDQEGWNGNLIDLELGDHHSGVTVDTNFNGYADTLYMWGANGSGQLGNNSTSDLSFPTIILLQDQDDWNGNLIDLELGYAHSGVTVDTNNDQYADTLYMWGSDSSGQLGDDSNNNLIKIPTKITPQGADDWAGNLIDLSLGSDFSGLTIDTNLDGYADTLYMWGNNNYNQLGNDTLEQVHYPILIDSSYYFVIQNLEFNNNNERQVEVYLKLNDYQNIIDQVPEVILIDQDDNQYTTTYIEDKSNIENDQYYYLIDDTLDGDSYQFTEILINGNIFNFKQENVITDYLISSYQITNQQQEEITIDLDLSQNSDNFNFNNYTNAQKEIKVNYTDLDRNITNSQEFIIDDSYQIILTNLNAETNYQIDSIDYFYEDGNYKYTINQDATQFQTSSAVPIIEADSILLIENSITTISFQYTIEIDNLKTNQTNDNFTQYDVNNGIWLIDDQGQTYNSSFIDAKVIANGQINGTQNYKLTFLQDDLTPGEIYNFTGIGFNDPNGSNPDIINFQEQFIVETVSVDKQFVDNTFLINENSITTSSFNYQITIDNLIYSSDDSNNEPIFTNFNQEDGLYLEDENNNIYNSNYMLGSAILIGDGTEEGTVKYQFTFTVNDLEPNTTYNFVSLSFTNNFETSVDISQNGVIKTDNNVTEKAIIYLIIIILILIILLGLILLWVDLRMKKRTKTMMESLDDPDKFDK